MNPFKVHNFYGVSSSREERKNVHAFEVDNFLASFRKIHHLQKIFFGGHSDAQELWGSEK